MLTTDDMFYLEEHGRHIFEAVSFGTSWAKCLEVGVSASQSERTSLTQFWIQYNSPHYNNDHYHQLQVEKKKSAITNLSPILSHSAASHVPHLQWMGQHTRLSCFFLDKLSGRLISDLNKMNHKLLLYNTCHISWRRSQEGVWQTDWLPVSSRGPSWMLDVAGCVLPGGHYAWSGFGKLDRQTFSPQCECVGGATTRLSGRISSRSLPTCT